MSFRVAGIVNVYDVFECGLDQLEKYVGRIEALDGRVLQTVVSGRVLNRKELQELSNLIGVNQNASHSLR
jgi:hypothetical protein